MLPSHLATPSNPVHLCGSCCVPEWCRAVARHARRSFFRHPACSPDDRELPVVASWFSRQATRLGSLRCVLRGHPSTVPLRLIPSLTGP